MANRGRPPKPASQRVFHRPSRERRLTVVPAFERAVIPSPPLSPTGVQLCDRALLLWDAYWFSPVSRALDGIAGVDRYVVERWIRAVDELERVAPIFAAALLVQGSMGQLSLNPLSVLVRDLHSEIHRYEDTLGLNPAARARLGIVIGEERLTAARLNEDLDRAMARAQPKR